MTIRCFNVTFPLSPPHHSIAYEYVPSSITPSNTLTLHLTPSNPPTPHHHTLTMGCGASSLRGDDVAINATAKPSYMRRYSTPNNKPTPYTEHYETPQEHARDLARVETLQHQQPEVRRASRPAYVDPNDMPMPPKTTHQHYHRLQSDAKANEANEGWKGRVKKVNMPVSMPQMPQMPTRRQRGTDGSGVVANNVRHRSFIG